MVARVVERGVIGVDLGGTKLLAGAVDADLGIHHRTNRPVYGLDQDGLVQMVADAVQEIRTAVDGEIEAVGFGIPCTFDSRTGRAVQAANAPILDMLVPRGDVRAARAARDRRQRRQLRGPVRGARGRRRRLLGGRAADDRDRDRRRPPARRRGLSRLDRRRRRDGPHGRGDGRPAVPVQLPELRVPGDGLLRHRARAAGVGGGRAAPGHGARARARGGARADRAADHAAGPGGRPGGARRDRADRPHGSGSASCRS